MVILYILGALVVGFAVGATIALFAAFARRKREPKRYSYDAKYTKKDVKHMAAVNKLAKNQNKTVDGTSPADQYAKEPEQYGVIE